MDYIGIWWNGRVYRRIVYRERGFYVIESKGVKYMYGKDLSTRDKYNGWHSINSKTIPDIFMEQIVPQLDALYKRDGVDIIRR